MIAVEHIEHWRGKELLDSEGESLGKLREVFFDAPTDTPILFSIRSGLLGRHAKLIPADGATVGPDHVRVAHTKATIQGSPDADREEPPNALELDEIGKAYGLRFADRVELESATVLQARRAEAEAARQRAEQAEAEAKAKTEALQNAQSRSEGASAEADRAQREAEEARDAARKARLEADRHDDR